MIATSSMTVFMFYWFGFMALWLVVGAGTYLAISFVSGGRKKTRQQSFSSNRYKEEAKSKFYALQLEEIVDTWKGGSGIVDEDIREEVAEKAVDDIVDEVVGEAVTEDSVVEEVLNEAEIRDFQKAALAEEIESFTNHAKETEEVAAQEETETPEETLEEEELEDVPVSSREDEDKRWRSAEDIFSGLFKSK